MISRAYNVLGKVSNCRVGYESEPVRYFNIFPLHIHAIILITTNQQLCVIHMDQTLSRKDMQPLHPKLMKSKLLRLFFAIPAKYGTSVDHFGYSSCERTYQPNMERFVSFLLFTVNCCECNACTICLSSVGLLRLAHGYFTLLSSLATY